MTSSKFIKKCCLACAPYGAVCLYRRLARKWRGGVIHPSNQSLKNKHIGERCFILCNGPSVNQQDLKLLKGEKVISVSNGYRHPDYLEFQPMYHCLPQVTKTLLITENDICAWFNEMHAALGTATVFLSDTEKQLVESHGLFPGREIHYLALTRPSQCFPANEIIDISRPCMGVQSVPIMCLMIAMFMGFTKIYLIGAEHDSFLTGRYQYFYGEPTAILKNKHVGVKDDGTILSGRYEELQSLAVLWGQYRFMKAIATSNGIEILNATAGGALDEFPRVKLEDIKRGK